MGKQKKSLMVSMGIMLLIIASAFAFGIFRKTTLDSSSQELAIAVTESALEGDGADALVRLAYNNELNGSPAADYQTRISQIQYLLGAFQSVNSIVGGSQVSLLPWSNELPRAIYMLDIDFQRGSAQAELEMIFENNQWAFVSFLLEAEKLMN